MNAVWHSQLPKSVSKNKRATVKIVLLKLADNANDNGKCWPSMARIAHETELSERSVIRAIEDLKESNLIHVNTHRKNGVKHNTYYINTPLMESLRLEFESSKQEENDNPFINPSDNLSEPSDNLSKIHDRVAVKPSSTTKEPSYTDISKADDHLFSISDVMDRFPMCSDAIHKLTSLGEYGYKFHTGKLSISEWEDCELAMKSVDEFNVEYFTWWVKERYESFRKAPSLPNMLADVRGIPFEEFYNSTFMQEWE